MAPVHPGRQEKLHVYPWNVSRMLSIFYWVLAFLPFIVALMVFYAFSHESYLRGYLLGLVPIFLLWQVVSIITLPGLKKSMAAHSSDAPYEIFSALFYGYIFLVLILYTGVALSSRAMYDRVIWERDIRQRSTRFWIASGLVVFSTICAVGSAVGFCALTFYIGDMQYDLFRLFVIFIPLHYPVVKIGVPYFIVLDGLLLVLVLARCHPIRSIWKRRSM
jgi:hypothetical protein